MHVKGFTQRHPLIPESDRGTFAGLSHPAIPAYLRSLGVTSVELLPIHSFIDDSYLVDKGLRNYWGYSSIGFFAPETRYLRTDGANEFKTMINQFHAHGLEIILDVVYNHTAEGNELGPTLSFKGIDNASYYRIRACCRWWRIPCAIGRPKCGSTAFASISPPSLRASLTASMKAAAFSMPAGRTRCCPASS
jgi:pullulanase/glycogen debranching enzyme